MKRKTISLFFLMVLALSTLTGCATATPATAQPAATSAATLAATAAEATAVSTAVASAAPATAAPSVDPAILDAYAKGLTFNTKAWQYDATNDVYWQIGIKYVTKPETTDYETLGIYVPGVYMTATANGDGTFTATLNDKGTLNGFTAKTAPMVFPVNTPGYSAQKAPTAYSYDEVSSYLKAGFIYV